MDEITTLRELRPVPPPAELEARRMAAREQFVAGNRSRRARQQWRRPVLAGGLTAAAAGAAAAALVLTSGPARPAPSVVTAAWTVREAADGTVTIYLKEYADPAALQQTLKADGINAIIRQIPSEPVTVGHLTVAWPTCNYFPGNAAPQAVQRAVWMDASAGTMLPERFVIHPDAMPQGSALFLTFLRGMPPSAKNGDTGVLALKPMVLNNDTVPTCVPRTKPVPTSGKAIGR